MIGISSLIPFITNIVPLLSAGIDIEPVDTTQSTPKLTEHASIEIDMQEGWGLSAEEWTRYDTLMQGVRGRLSDPNISPIEVLGIHARTMQERNHYAEKWAQIMFEDTVRVLLFQRAYDQAARALFAEYPMIDPTLIPHAEENELPGLHQQDRIMVFTRLDCSICEVVLPDVLAQLPNIAGIDIYFVDASLNDRETINNWVRDYELDLELIHDNQITLNFDEGLLKSLNPLVKTTPVLMRRRNDEIVHLPIQSLR